MKAKLPVIVWVLALGVLASCGAPAKYSYYFSTYSQEPHGSVAAIHDEGSVELEEISAPADVLADEAPIATPGEMPQTTTQYPAQASKEYLANGMELKHKSEYTRQEKKQIRMDYKAEVKTYKKAVKEGNTIKAQESAKQLTGYTRTGVILGIAGIVLMILGTSTVASIGGLLLLVGVIFILVDVL